MFNQKPQTPTQKCSFIDTWKEDWKRQEETIQNIHDLLKKKWEEEQLITETQELITINQSGYEFESLGIPFNAVIVDDRQNGERIHVDYKGLKYDIVLSSGVNQLNILDGSVLTNDTGIVVGLIRTQHPVKL